MGFADEINRFQIIFLAGCHFLYTLFLSSSPGKIVIP
jgi:hypothetical protein